MLVSRLSFISALLFVLPADAHEFWIEPEEFQVESDTPITATLRNGENFSGVSLAWFDRQFTRFEAYMADDVFPVTGRMGDTPALQMTSPPQDGLMVVLHETTASSLTYREWDKFIKFVEHKDFSHAVSLHEENGWPKEGFRESYTRHAKALIAVGHGQGTDRAFGMATEFVALSNPYESSFDGNMKVRVLYQNEPRKDAQIEVFDRAPDGNVTVSLHRTDAAGSATIPVEPGHDYLFDAVVLRPTPESAKQGGENDPIWDTLWAALTFSVPAR